MDGRLPGPAGPVEPPGARAGEFWGSLASGSRKRGGSGGGVGGCGGPGYGGPCDLAGLSRVLTPEHQTEGQLPLSSAPPDFSFLVPRAGRPTTAGEARVAWGCGARPCGRQPVVFVRLQRPSSAPALLCPLDWPRVLPSPQPFSLQDFQGAGSLTPSTPSVQRAFLLYPQTRNFPRLQTPSLASAAAPRRDPSHLPAPGNCRGGGLFPRRPPLAPVHAASSPCVCVECVFLPGAPTLPGSCVWYTEAMATAPPHPSSRKPCGFLFVPLQLSLLLADVMVRGCAPGGSSVTGVHHPCPACPLCPSLWGQGPPLAPSE